MIEGIKLSGKVAIVTGGAGGIGIDTSRGSFVTVLGDSVTSFHCAALASAGAHVFLAVRDPSAYICRFVHESMRVARVSLRFIAELAQSVVDDIKKSTGNPKVEALAIDLGDLKSVAAFVAEFTKRKLPLHLLINNAGNYCKSVSRSSALTKVCRRDGVPAVVDEGRFRDAIRCESSWPFLFDDTAA